MENLNETSGNPQNKPEIAHTNSRTLDDVMIELQEIINKTHWIETRLARLKACGYKVEECWVKNGRVTSIFYMKRKQEFRIQVSEPELYGKYYKAHCVMIPITEIKLGRSDISRVRNLTESEIDRMINPDTKHNNNKQNERYEK